MSRAFLPGVVVLALAAALVPVPPAWVESIYSQGVYPIIQRHVTAWGNASPFAVTDVLILTAVVCAAVWARWVWRLRRRQGARTAIGRGVATAAASTAAVYLAFLAMWGLNYRREPLTVRLDFDRSRVTSESVRDLGRLAASRANALHDRVHASPWPAWEDLPGVLGPSFARVLGQLAQAPAAPGVPKASALTFYFERAGVSGMTDPFALEVVVDRSQLPVERPFVAAHEWAHLAGYANEAEANFIAWLVCIQGPPQAEYSGELELLMHVIGSLPAAEREVALGAVGAGPRRDLAEIARRAGRAWPWLQRPAWWFYDRYLRANRVEQGVQSYGAALQLIAGTRFEPAWVPRIRR